MRDDTAFAPHVERVRDEWIDYNGHLSEAYYVLVFGHATDDVMDALGMDEAYRTETGCSLFTVEAHIRYLDQVGPGDELEVRTRLTGGGDKRLNLMHEMYVGNRLRATEEIVTLHVDTGAGRTAPFPEGVAARIASRVTGTSS
ncbi:MAG: thioesterase family protein [Nocardioidaceae bacterium]